jgi:hypothetical protein
MNLREAVRIIDNMDINELDTGEQEAIIILIRAGAVLRDLQDALGH